jgi:hypothetical protein
MKNVRGILFAAAWALVALAVAGSLTDPLSAQSYDPVGPQTDVDDWVVEQGGWSLCFSSPYATWTGPWLPTIETLCTGEKLMLACGAKLSPTLTLLAAAPREEVLEDCGDDPAASHLANGSQWYHNHAGEADGAFSWGFAGAGATVARDSCDISSDDAGLRLCWHLEEAGGYRCGAAQDLNWTPSWRKYVYRWSSAVFADGFEGEGGVCRWGQTGEAAGECEESLVLDFAPGCGGSVADQGAFDLDPVPGRIGYRLGWSSLQRAWGYRLQTDYSSSTTIEIENEFVEVPAGTVETPIRICHSPENCSWTYRVIAHVGHWGGHDDVLAPDDLVSNVCTVLTDWNVPVAPEAGVSSPGSPPSP